MATADSFNETQTHTQTAESEGLWRQAPAHIKTAGSSKWVESIRLELRLQEHDKQRYEISRTVTGELREIVYGKWCLPKGRITEVRP